MPHHLDRTHAPAGALQLHQIHAPLPDHQPVGDTRVRRRELRAQTTRRAHPVVQEALGQRLQLRAHAATSSGQGYTTGAAFTPTRE
nr:MAG TPA: hypothetical protein [Caudoviricetes sp.]